MDIPTYIKKKGLTQREFGQQVGASQGLVSRWCNDPSSVSPDMAKQIEEKTDGQITRKELLRWVFA